MSGDDMAMRVAQALYACEKERSDRCDAILSAAKGKAVTATMEPWEECWQVFHHDAQAALEAANVHDLLESLEWAIRELNGQNRYDEDVADQQEQNCFDRARAAIARATGAS